MMFKSREATGIASFIITVHWSVGGLRCWVPRTSTVLSGIKIFSGAPLAALAVGGILGVITSGITFTFFFTTPSVGRANGLSRDLGKRRALPFERRGGCFGVSILLLGWALTGSGVPAMVSRR